MGYMKKYKCPLCHSTSSVIRQTKRKRAILYKCKACIKYFSIKTNTVNKKVLLNDHLDGLSFRKLAQKYMLSPMTTWRICEEELKKLPDNNKFTFTYCNRYSDIFVFDGKYFSVKGQDTGYALLWGIDYLRHDIPVFLLAPSESYSAWATCFSYFRIINHYPRLVVCDDNANLKLAARNMFPQVTIQTCYNHFKEAIRRNLRVRSDATYKPFMKRLEAVLSEKLNDETINKRLFALYRDYRHDPVCVQVLTTIEKYKPELLGYRGFSQAPITTNIIEGLNSHLEARLFSLRSFQSVRYARLWFNGYILKRRYTKFTDCKGKFRSLNGKRGVDMSKKQEIDLPTFF
jgi:Transposase, Mutator family